MLTLQNFQFIHILTSGYFREDEGSALPVSHFFTIFFASKIVSFTRNYSKVFINFAVEIIPKSIIKIRVYG